MLNFFLRRIVTIKNNPIFKNILYLFSSSVLSQIISLLVLPFITRFYEIESFATQAIFISSASIISSIGTGQYHYAILAEKKKGNETLSLYLSVIVLFITTLSILTLLAGITIFKPQFFFLGISMPLILLMFLYALLNGLIVSFQFFLNANEHFKIVGIGRLIMSIVTAFFLLSFGYLKYQEGLIYSLVLGCLIQFTFLFFNSRGLIKGSSIKLSSLKELAKEYKHLPLYSLPQTFVDSLRSNLFVFLIKFFYGQTVLGYFSLAERVVRIPLTFISSAISEVLFKYIADLYNTDSGLLYNKVKIYTIRFLIVIVPVVFLLSFQVDTIVKVIFGDQWLNSGTIIKYYLPLLIIWFVASPLSIIPILTRRQRTYFVISFAMFTVSHLGFYVGALLEMSFYSVILIKNTTELIFLIYLCYWNLNSLLIKKQL